MVSSYVLFFNIITLNEKQEIAFTLVKKWMACGNLEHRFRISVL